MIGQGSPIRWHISSDRAEPAQEGDRLRRLLVCALTIALFFSSISNGTAEEIVARLRLAWGTGNDSMQRWTGEITCEGGSFSDIQVLGTEADEAAAIRLEEARLAITPLVKRRFDGCDVTIRAPREAVLHVKLRSEQSPEPRVIEAPLGQIVDGQVSEPLDDFGSRFQAHRAPGDKLRVIPPSDSMVFAPNEHWNLRLQPDLAREVAAGPVLLNLELRAFRDSTVLWRASQRVTAQSAKELSFDINCPAKENVYRLSIEARSQDGFAEKIVPWQHAKVFASRVVEFVVIDPNAKLPVLTDNWQPVISIDPANPGWWERMPSWTQVSRLRGRPPGAIGNVRPVVRPLSAGSLVELPATRDGGDPYWQAFTLPVRDPDAPHLIEIEYPAGVEQHLSISIIEPDAAGRVTRPTVDSGVYCHETSDAEGSTVAVHRMVFWPHTRTPQLLLVNRHETQPAQFGKLRLLRHDDSTLEVDSTVETGGTRLIASYLSKPNLGSQFGAAEVLDSSSGLSVHGWKTFLDAARRYAQYLKLTGQNGALLTVAADGSGLYPSQVMQFSPKYDTGIQASAAQDPTRKDVLEMLLRIFDREGLQLVPTVQLCTPLPKIESQRNGSEPGTEGIELVNHAGLTFLQQFETTNGQTAYYNPLNETVQQEMTRVIAELAERYQHHRSLAGVAVQLSGRGYSMLPGPAWAVDDQTASMFSAETGIQLPSGENRFLERARTLVGPQQEPWRDWRCRRMAHLYEGFAKVLQAKRSDLRLLLTTEELFDGERQRQQLRESLNRPVQLASALQDYGLNLQQIDQLPQVTVLNPYRLNPSSSLQQQALDLQLSVESEQGTLVPEGTGNSLVYHLPSKTRLASFDSKSPYGADLTRLSLESVAVTAERSANKQLVRGLARGELETFVRGGTAPLLGQHDALRKTMKLLQALPPSETLSETVTHQPIVLKVYRHGESTTVLALNLSPWPLEATLPLTISQECQWLALEKSESGDPNADGMTSGTLSSGSHPWELAFDAHAMKAWRFSSSEVAVGEPQLAESSLAERQLQQLLDDISSRTGNLNIQRPYLELQNPGFELLQNDESIFGWQQRSGPPTAFTLAKGEARSGEVALRILSDVDGAVAIESHPMAMPATGELTVGVSVLVKELDDNTKLYIVLQDERDGSTYQQYAVLGAEQLQGEGWAPFEFPVSDVPLDNEGRVRVQFHLVGKGNVLIDDVELFDLRFDNARRGALVKRVFAARTALQEGRVVDCQRLLDSYWARHLLEYVPQMIEQPTSVAKQPVEPKEEPATEEESGFSDRLKGWVPGIWR